MTEEAPREDKVVARALGDREAFLDRCDYMLKNGLDYAELPWSIADVMLGKHVAEALGTLAARLRVVLKERDEAEEVSVNLAADLLRAEEALRETKQHLRPEVGGRFDQHAAVASIDAYFARAALSPEGPK